MTGMQWTYRDPTGVAWDLTSGPVRLDKRGVEGAGEPEYVRSTRTYAGRSGQKRTAPSTAKARSGYLPFFLAERDAAARVATERAWWAAWDVDQPGRLTVTQPDGSSRFIDVCLVDDDDYAPSKDPYTRGTDRLGVHWVADDTWWLGPAVTRLFDQASSSSFFGPTGYGPPFTIGSTNVLATATLANAGDRDAPVQITVAGPETSFDFRINGHRVAGAIPLVAGQQLLLDSDPAVLGAFRLDADGTRTDVTTQLTAADFASLPKRSTVPFTASLIGVGSITVAHQPRYRRAW